MADERGFKTRTNEKERKRSENSSSDMRNEGTPILNGDKECEERVKMQSAKVKTSTRQWFRLARGERERH